MNIAIDCRMIDASGVGTYLDGCLPQFIESKNNLLLIGNKDKLLTYINNKSNCNIINCNFKPFSFRELLFFPRNIIKQINQCDLFYSPYFNIPSGIKRPIYTTIHDIIFPDVPELVSPIGLKARMFFYRRAARLSKIIFTVSEFSKTRIEFHLSRQISRYKTPVINASNAIKYDNIEPVPAENKKKNIIFIGNIKKHKGLGILLDAFINCIKTGLDYKLIIIGNKNNFRSKDTQILSRLDSLNDGNLIFTGFLPESEKIKYLSEAALLVQPSLYEGFGFPPLEAMLLGTHALISDIPVLKEVYGEFPVIFFKAGDSLDLEKQLMKLLFNKKPRGLTLPSHLKQKYTFKKTVSIILSQMEKSLNKQ